MSGWVEGIAGTVIEQAPSVGPLTASFINSVKTFVVAKIAHLRNQIICSLVKTYCGTFLWKLDMANMHTDFKKVCTTCILDEEKILNIYHRW